MKSRFDKIVHDANKPNRQDDMENVKKPIFSVPPREMASTYHLYLKKAQKGLAGSHRRFMPTCGETLTLLFKDAMDTHKRMPDRSSDRLRVVGSNMPEIAKTLHDCNELAFERAISDMDEHDGNKIGAVHDNAAIDRMHHVIDLVSFIRSKHWYRLRRLVLMRAAGGTVIECSQFWQPGRKAFSRQYLSQLILSANGEIFKGMERRFGIYRHQNNIDFILKEGQEK